MTGPQSQHTRPVVAVYQGERSGPSLDRRQDDGLGVGLVRGQPLRQMVGEVAVAGDLDALAVAGDGGAGDGLVGPQAVSAAELGGSNRGKLVHHLFEGAAVDVAGENPSGGPTGEAEQQQHHWDRQQSHQHVGKCQLARDAVEQAPQHEPGQLQCHDDDQARSGQRRQGVGTGEMGPPGDGAERDQRAEADQPAEDGGRTRHDR